MKILPIQNNFSIQSNNQKCKPRQTAFKGQLITNALIEAQVPHNVNEWVKSLAELLNSVKSEPKFKTTDPELFNELLKKSTSIDKVEKFITKHIKNRFDYGEGLILAYDGKSPSMLLKKDTHYNIPRNYIQFSDGKHYAQFGLTDINNRKTTIEYYNDNNVYLDYHNLGSVRKLLPLLGDAKYFKPDGSRDYLGAIKELINGY